MTVRTGPVVSRVPTRRTGPVPVSADIAGGSGGSPVTVPSGQEMRLAEVLIDVVSGETWVRFRFVAPRIGVGAGRIGYDVTARDMDHLCDTLAIPYLSEYGLEPARVVISVADRDLPFGASQPEATQFFEAYTLENARCIWEQF